MRLRCSYTGRYFEGTTINGIDVSGMTSEEVEAKLAEQIDDYSLSLLSSGQLFSFL